MDGVDFVGQIAGWQQPTGEQDAVGTPIFDELLRRYVARIEDIDAAAPAADKLVDV
ncbi:hypothetical protein [Gandjariella thermophila]|uniref:Uncharacterized protein n=1 Tax=Gandjariella thermophila TaxID=1931992 RepID=A0A4D4J0R8_9PSEU|nr:hypothetical protein [Gandjariella thermophila]GDY28672.1 hypothetical protein GTS_03050 [Gandjariella thermophila]